VAAKHLSFTLAAKELNVTQGAVSQQIRLLETGARYCRFSSASTMRWSLPPPAATFLPPLPPDWT
jgi:DNA-binding transcriptional LysR family regulator